MRIAHLSDLHLGKRLNGFSMLEDQEFILLKILEVLDAKKPQAVIIAGDVYDKPIPPAEAVQLFDDFLYKLSKRDLQVFVISGNHDSAERIAFGARLMDKSGIHMSQVYDGTVEPVTLQDECGAVNFYLLPFVKPIHVRRFYEEAEISSYTDAIRVAIEHMHIGESSRNVLVAHQFVTGATRSESEEITVGGLDNVDASVFDPFDYVALGHIHGPQYIGRDTVRYSGTPLKYSFSEKDHTKSVTMIDIQEKGNVQVSAIPLVPRHELREIRGSYEELTLKSNYEGTATDDYLHIILTDEEDVPDAVGRLRNVYPNLMKLDYDNTRTRTGYTVGAAEDVEKKTEIELLQEFYEKQNGQAMSEVQTQYAINLFEQIKEGRR